jgi:PadR family transcriptional regulator, regulatory protein PadR
LVATHLQELRRGTVVVACLALLHTPRYGYDLLDVLPDAGLLVEGNTLYPLLRRLEAQGLLTSEWNTDESRPRRFYRTSPEGRRLLAVLRDEWRSLEKALGPLLEDPRLKEES